MEDIQKNVDVIQSFEPTLFENKAFTETLIKKFPSDEKIALLVIKDNPKAVQFIDPHLLKDRSFAEKLVDINGLMLEFLTDFKADLDIVKKALSTNKVAAKFVDPSLLQNRDLAFEIVKFSGGMKLLPHFADDDEIGEAAVKYWSWHLADLSPRLRGKENILLLVAAIESSDLQYATDEALSNPVIAKKLVLSDGDALKPLKKFRSDEKIALLAVKTTPDAIKYVSAILLKDPIIAQKFIAINPKNKTIVLKTIKYNAEAVQFIDKDLLTNRVFALQLIKVNKNVFPFLSTFQDDDEFKNLAK